MATPNINPAEAKINAGRCKLVRNKRNGAEFPRNDESPNAWYVLYERALLHPEEFEVEYEVELAETVLGAAQFTESELKSMNMPRLRKIALDYELTGNSKDELINGIIKAQLKARG